MNLKAFGQKPNNLPRLPARNFSNWEPFTLIFSRLSIVDLHYQGSVPIFLKNHHTLPSRKKCFNYKNYLMQRSVKTAYSLSNSWKVIIRTLRSYKHTTHFYEFTTSINPFPLSSTSLSIHHILRQTSLENFAVSDAYFCTGVLTRNECKCMKRLFWFDNWQKSIKFNTYFQAYYLH